MITRAQRVRGAGVLARPAGHRRASTRTGRRSAAASANYLAVRRVPRGRRPATLEPLYFPRGIVLNSDLTKVWPVRPEPGQGVHHQLVVRVLRGRRRRAAPLGRARRCRSTPARRPPWKYLQDETKYTWMKAPRYDGQPMEVGPLARDAGGLRRGPRGHPGDGRRRSLDRLEVGPAALFSTLGRAAARGMETVLLARQMDSAGTTSWSTASRAATPQTFNGDKWEPSTWPAKAQGYGYLDAPRGALGHWVQIENGKISRYQCVVPSTWNCSPRDDAGADGPVRGGADGQPSAAQAGPAARDPAHDPLVRSLHGLRRPRARRDGQPDHGGQGPMTVPRRARPARRPWPSASRSAHRCRRPAATTAGSTSGNGRSGRCTGSRRCRIVVLVVTGSLHRPALLRDQRRGQRPLPDGVDPASSTSSRPACS